MSPIIFYWSELTLYSLLMLILYPISLWERTYLRKTRATMTVNQTSHGYSIDRLTVKIIRKCIYHNLHDSIGSVGGWGSRSRPESEELNTK